MQHPAAPFFDPTWSDEIFDVQAITLPLALPDATPANDRAWINVRAVLYETIFGNQHVYESPRLETSVLKPSDMARYYTVQDGRGNIVTAADPAMAIIFPAQAWMSDSGEERCMMFAAAKQAKGHVLVGGLGLGVYPQFVFALERPVASVTIVERVPEIIEWVTHAWLGNRPDHAEKVTIVEGTIEAYLSETERTFDTVYLDTWEDADPRFLAHVNHLLALAARRCAAGGTIQCWGYARMINVFAECVQALTRDGFSWRNHHLDPVLQAYVHWLDNQDRENLSDDAIVQAATMFALTTRQSIETYDRHRCFTAFGESRADAYRKMALSHKSVS